MFRSKRSSLVKRLWKYRANDETKSSSQKDTSTSSQSTTTTTSSQEEFELKSVTHSFFKRLREDQLEILVQAMESKGGEVTPCVPVSKVAIRLGKCMVSPYILCCRVFRWPDLKSDAEMKRLPSCMRQNEESEAVVCCNPYHWSQVVKIDEPPIHPDKLIKSPAQPRSGDRTDKSTGDQHPRIMENHGRGFNPSKYQDDFSDSTEQTARYNCLLWCTIAYWELRERVGRLFSVDEPSVHIFQQLPHGDGMCLRLFQKPTNVDVVKRTREKIGFGIILSREAAHRNDVCLAGRESMMEETSSSVTTTEVTVSPASPPSRSVPSPLRPLSPSHEMSVTKNNSFSLATSNSGTMKPSSGAVTTGIGDISDFVHDAGGGPTAGSGKNGVTPHYRDAGCEVSPALDYHHGHQQHYSDDSVHGDPESMDYMPNVIAAPSIFQSPYPQSRSPSCLSSLSASSSSPISPILYLNSDTSSSSLHQSGLDSNCGTSVSHITTADEIINNTTKSHITTADEIINNTANNHRNSRSFNPRATTSAPTNGNNKSLVSPDRTTNFTDSQTTVSSITSSNEVSSNLLHKQGEVWAYNASNFPIFVNSPTLDDPQSPRSLVVKKVPPGYSIKIFDYARAELLERTKARSMLLNDGPFDPCSVRISLAKGWGPNYSRQFITSCPCWLEILLGARRHSLAS